MHPYVLKANVELATAKLILRSFVTSDLKTQANLLHQIAQTIEAEHPRCKIAIEITEQYRNMAEGLKKEPRALSKAQQAMSNLGIQYEMHSIRGGTDGSRLTEMGLPTPNLSAGMHNFHSPLEFACLEEMQQSVDVLIELAKEWVKN